MKRRRMTERERRLVTAIKYATKWVEEAARRAASACGRIESDTRSEYEFRKWAFDQIYGHQCVAENHAEWLRSALRDYAPRKRGGK